MNKEIKEKWLKALRSGDYTQGIGALRNADSAFCCLGVLCDIVKDEMGLHWIKYVSGYQIADSVAMPTEVINKYVGINQHNGYKVATTEKILSKYDGRSAEKHLDYINLSGLNDAGFTFEEIADIIEKQF